MNEERKELIMLDNLVIIIPPDLFILMLSYIGESRSDWSVQKIVDLWNKFESSLKLPREILEVYQKYTAGLLIDPPTAEPKNNPIPIKTTSGKIKP